MVLMISIYVCGEYLIRKTFRLLPLRMHKKPLITIFLSGYRPHENLSGLLCQALIENQSFDFILIDSLFSSYIHLTDRPSLSRNSSLLSFARNLYLIYKSSLIFGKVHPCLRLLSKLFFGTALLSVFLPGKSPKELGFLNLTIYPFLKSYLI